MSDGKTSVIPSSVFVNLSDEVILTFYWCPYDILPCTLVFVAKTATNAVTFASLADDPPVRESGPTTLYNPLGVFEGSQWRVQTAQPGSPGLLEGQRVHFCPNVTPQNALFLMGHERCNV